MKKIGLVTFCWDNYGSALQCYSTKKFLNDQGFDCQLIEHSFSNYPKSIIRMGKYANILLNSIKHPSYFTNFIEMRKTSKITKNTLDKVSKADIIKFVNIYICPVKYTSKELKKIAVSNEYKFFITGSDQVWNPSLEINKDYFLQFVPRDKRIAFAPSFGVDKIPIYAKKPLIKYLKSIQYLSVREESGEQIIHDLIGIHVPRLSDPVVLFDKHEWSQFCDISDSMFNNYILLHFLNDLNEETVEFINSIAENSNMKIVCFAYHEESFKIIKNSIFVNGGPKEYLNLIGNANLIITDSFHTSMFSIIFNKDFYTFSRNYTNKSPQHSRISDLLNRYSLSDRFVEKGIPSSNKKINFTEANIKLNEERNKASTYLVNILKSKELI